MKRDMDLIRQLAFLIEESSDAIDSKDLRVDGYDAAQIGYHCDLMHESDMIVAHSTMHMRSEYPEFNISRLSSLGHDFVDAARNDTLWKKATNAIKKTVGGVTVELLIAYLKQQAADLLGIRKTQ